MQILNLTKNMLRKRDEMHLENERPKGMTLSPSGAGMNT
jgi:hypothetical protein